MTSKGRIPSLDGLRAISVLLVVFSHSFPTVKHYIDLGNIGVRMFFIISSYLITGILYRDVVKERFSLKTFYFKRIMRTFPAFYFFLGLMFIALYFVGNFDWSQFWRAPIYLENYHPRDQWNGNQWFVGHSWSLAVEEQFYVLIAILFTFFNRKNLTKKGLVRFFIGIILAVVLIRILYMRGIAPIFSQGSLHRSFETVCDALATGALGYLLKVEISKAVLKYYKSGVLLFCGILIITIAALNSSVLVSEVGYIPRYLYNIFGIGIINFSMLFVMFFAMDVPNKSYFNKFLNLKLISYIGLLSYSIYLWQQPWLYYQWPISLPLRYLGIAVSALISYYLVEEKFLKIRDRMLFRKNDFYS